MGKIISCVENPAPIQRIVSYAFKDGLNRDTLSITVALRHRRQSDTKYNISLDVELSLLDRSKTVLYTHKEPFHIVVTTTGGSPFEKGMTDHTTNALLPVFAWAINGQIMGGLAEHQRNDPQAPKGFIFDPVPDADLISCIRQLHPIEENPNYN